MFSSVITKNLDGVVLRMATFNMGVHWKIQFLGEGVSQTSI